MAYEEPSTKNVADSTTSASQFESSGFNLNASTVLGDKWNVREHNRIIVSAKKITGTWATAQVQVLGYVHPHDVSPTVLATLTAEGKTSVLEIEEYQYIDLSVSVVEGATGTANFRGHGYFRPFEVASGDIVTASSNIADNAVVRGDGGAKGIQGSSASITDSGNLTSTQLTFSDTLTNQSTFIVDTGAGTVTISDPLADHLDLGANNITNVGTVDGRDVSTDGTKLDTVETNADVTDATNVNAAGATMNTDTSLSGNSYFLDEDTMSSDDATKVVSQQSVKAYVDAEVLHSVFYAQASSTSNIGTSLGTIGWTTQITDTGYSESLGIVTIGSELNGKRGFIEWGVQADGATGNVMVEGELQIDTGGGYSTVSTVSFVRRNATYDSGSASASYVVDSLSTSDNIRVQAIRTGNNANKVQTGTFLRIVAHG